MKDPTTEQLEEVRARFGAHVQSLPDGSKLITLPKFELPEGWSTKATSIRFLVPVGYPYAKPVSFWTDASLRTRSGDIPANTTIQRPWAEHPEMLWFSWHPTYWDAQRDTLESFIHVIQNRLRNAL